MAERDLHSRFFFDVRTPTGISTISREPVTGPQIVDLVRDLNLVLQRVSASMRDVTGFSGNSPQFAADTDFQGHRLLRVGDPLLDTDGVNLGTLKDEVAKIDQSILRIDQIIHHEIPPSTLRDILVTRDLPTGANDTVHIGHFRLTNDSHSLDLAITVATGASTSLAKRYLVEVNRSINAAWETVLPFVDTGVSVNSDDFDLEAFQDDANSQVSLRLRRTAGTSTAATATVHIHQRGLLDETFIESITTAVGVTATTAFFENTLLIQRDENVGLQEPNPAFSLHGAVHTTGACTIALDGYGDSPIIISRRAGGSRAAPSAVQSGNLLLRISGRGTTGSTFLSTTAIRLDFQAEESWTGAAQGAGFVFNATPPGSVTLGEKARLTGGGNWLLSTTNFGANATTTIVVANGTAPGSSPANMFQEYSGTTSTSVSCPYFLPDDGNAIRLFRQAALTVTSATTFNAATTSGTNTNDQAIINNLITRTSEIEARLRILGLLP